MQTSKKPETEFPVGSLLEQRAIAIEEMRTSMRSYGKEICSSKEKAQAFIERLS